MEKNLMARPRWSTIRRMPKSEVARIERLRKALRAEYGKWLRIAEDTGVHYNSIQRFASGETQRPSERFLSHLERSLSKRKWEEVG